MIDEIQVKNHEHRRLDTNWRKPKQTLLRILYREHIDHVRRFINQVKIAHFMAKILEK